MGFVRSVPHSTYVDYYSARISFLNWKRTTERVPQRYDLGFWASQPPSSIFQSSLQTLKMFETQASAFFLSLRSVGGGEWASRQGGREDLLVLVRPWRNRRQLSWRKSVTWQHPGCYLLQIYVWPWRHQLVIVIFFLKVFTGKKLGTGLFLSVAQLEKISDLVEPCYLLQVQVFAFFPVKLCEIQIQKLGNSDISDSM